MGRCGARRGDRRPRQVHLEHTDGVTGVRRRVQGQVDLDGLWPVRAPAVDRVLAEPRAFGDGVARGSFHHLVVDVVLARRCVRMLGVEHDAPGDVTDAEPQHCAVGKQRRRRRDEARRVRRRSHRGRASPR